MKDKYKKENAWIFKKMSNGVTQRELLNGVGTFSNKKKEDVMKKKNISSKQYDKRYNFLSNVYYLLSNYKYKK